MKAIRVHAHGGPEVLRLEDLDVPQPASGQAVVQIAAAGLNFIDVYYRTGLNKPPSLPFTLGMEAAGTVIAVALTSQEPRAGYPLTVELTSSKLPKRSWVKTGQIRTLSTERVGRRLGRVSEEELAQVIDGLFELIG